MKKVSSIVSCLLVIVFFATCKKTPDTISVSGKAVDATTNTPIANAYLALGKYESTVNGIGISKLAEVYTDAGGNYSFNFNYEVGNEYHIAGKKDRYWDTDVYNDNKIPIQGSVDNFNIRITPKAYAKILVNKTDTTYNGLRILLETERTIDYSIQLTLPPYIKDSVIILFDGNKNNNIHFYIKKYVNGNIISDYQENHSIYCSAFDTVRYQINY